MTKLFLDRNFFSQFFLYFSLLKNILFIMSFFFFLLFSLFFFFFFALFPLFVLCFFFFQDVCPRHIFANVISLKPWPPTTRWWRSPGPSTWSPAHLWRLPTISASLVSRSLKKYGGQWCVNGPFCNWSCWGLNITLKIIFPPPLSEIIFFPPYIYLYECKNKHSFYFWIILF